MLTCPTCGNDNATSASHCERCGRPLADVRPDDGLASAPPRPESDNALHQIARVALPAPSLASLPAPPPFPAQLADEDALRRAVTHTPAQRPPEQRQTYHEGLPAVVVPPDHAAAFAAQVRSNAAATQAIPVLPKHFTQPDTPPTPEPTAHPSAPSSTLIVQRSSDASAGFFAGVFLTVLLAGALAAAAYYLRDDPHRDTEPAERATLPQERLLIPEGPFLRGLSNDLRLLLASTCKKVADNPEVECKEDVALKGEYPMETVQLPAFRIDAAEVTLDQWERCVQAGACQPIAWDACENRTTRGLLPFLRVPAELRLPERPVICVNRDEAAAYCAFAQGRLPSADEWEKTARGVDAFLFPWGSDWDPALANWGEIDIARAPITGRLDGFISTAPPGAFPKAVSRFGAYDMAGNVAEWVTSPDDTPLDTTARGGSWLSNPAELRATHRLHLKPDTRRTDVGLRCAAEP